MGDVMSKTNLDPAQVAQVIQAVLSALNETPSSVVDTAVREKPTELSTAVAKAPKTRNRQKRNKDFPNAAKPWTALQTEAATTLLNAGGCWTYSSVARLLGRTKSAVQTQMRLTRRQTNTSGPMCSAVPLNAWTEEEDAELLKMRQYGFVFVDIARKLNRTKDACKNRYHRLIADTADTKTPLREWTGSSVLNIPVDDVFGDQQAEAG